MMTIKYAQQPLPLSQDEFHAVDYQVMGQAFALHNEMGNLWDEPEYRQKLASKCTDIGLEVFEEVRVSFTHNSFTKNYFIDLLINRGIYELKTVAAIAKNHEAQDIPSILKSLLDDWGAYLSTTLYKEALCHFLGLPLESECQRFIALSSDTALHISGLSSKKNNLQNNLQKYLRVSQWHELLWINFDKNHIGLSCLHDSA